MARRRASVVLMVVAGALLGMVGWSWACTAQTTMMAPSPQTGMPGSEVTVRGQDVAPQGAVEIRWGAIDGPVVATATADAQGDFTASATVPDVAPGAHTIVAVAAGEDAVARTAFAVTGQGTAAPATQPVASWSGSEAGSPAVDGSPGPAPWGLAAGVALLAVGAVALFAGVALAALRPRPVAAPFPSDGAHRSHSGI